MAKIGADMDFETGVGAEIGQKRRRDSPDYMFKGRT